MKNKRPLNRELQYMDKKKQYLKDLVAGLITKDEYDDLLNDLKLIEEAKKENENNT
jgi:hypothetical protein